MRRVACTLVLLSSSLGACSLLVGSDAAQCSTDGDCRSRGGGFASRACVSGVCVTPATGDDASKDGTADEGGAAADSAGDGDASGGPWGCLGSVTAPKEDPTRSVTLNFQVTDIVSQPIAGMKVSVCYRADPNCKTPLAPVATTDAKGMVTVQVPYAARIFLAVTNAAPCSDASVDCYLDSLYYVDPPPTSTPPTTIIEALTPSAVNALTAAGPAPYPYSPQKGILILQLQDCTFTPNVPAPGVAFSLSSVGTAGEAGPSDTESFYLLDMTPDYMATETSSDGVGGFVNAPMGFTTITGTIVEGNRRIGQNEVFVQPDTVTYATIDPYEN